MIHRLRQPGQHIEIAAAFIRFHALFRDGGDDVGAEASGGGLDGCREPGRFGDGPLPVALQEVLFEFGDLLAHRLPQDVYLFQTDVEKLRCLGAELVESLQVVDRVDDLQQFHPFGAVLFFQMEVVDVIIDRFDGAVDLVEFRSVVPHARIQTQFQTFTQTQYLVVDGLGKGVERHGGVFE